MYLLHSITSRDMEKNDRVYDLRSLNLWPLNEFDEFVFRFGKISKKQVSEIRISQLQITNSSMS